MENIQRVHSGRWVETPQLVELYNNLPTTLRCSGNKSSTGWRKKNRRANEYGYIGYNPPNVTRYIVLDLDYPDAIHAYYDHNAPLPQFIVRNPLNGHCHYIYQLKDPVTFYAKSKSAPIRYLTATETALRELLRADRGYTGHLAKNALNTQHETYITGQSPYTLDELNVYLELETVKPTSASANDTTYGRNCGTFDAVRVQAYPLASELNYTQLYNECLALAEQHNAQYNNPMSYNEVKGIAKSIAGYCKSNRYTESLSERQAIRGAKGGIAKGKAYDNKRHQAKTLHEQGVNNTQISLKLGVSRRTVIRWLKN